MSAIKYIRFVVRLAALAGAGAALLGVLPWPAAPRFVPSASPFVAVCSAVAGGAFQLAWAAALVVAAACLVRPRWFCRWACPMGLLVETASTPRRMLLRRRAKAPPAARPAAATATPRVRIGPWVFWATLGGALMGYPLLLWLDPLVLLSASVGPYSTLTSAAAIALAGAGAILLLALLTGPIWCTRLCPLGAMQDVLSGPRRWIRVVRRAPGSVRSAPVRASDDSAQAAPDGGTSNAARRAVLSGTAALLAAGVGVLAGLRLRRRSREGAPLRPPGAVGEDRFTGVCIRCGACVRACPAHILRSDLAPASLAGWLAPRVEFASDYCREDCTRCMDVCPSGALRAVPLPRKQEAKIGLARVDLTLCWLATGRECNSCIHACPYQAIQSVWDEDVYSSKPVINAELCNGCGACQPVCPSAPQAIRVAKA